MDGVSFRSAFGSRPETLAGVPAADDAEFIAWVRPHWPIMHRLACRLAPDSRGDDALQEALAAAWRKRAQFDAARGTARVWLLAIVADQSRKQYRHLAPSVELLEDAAGAPADSEVAARLDLIRLLDRLTQRQRLAVSLYYYVDLPLADVAAVMGCSAGTVKSTLADARAKLRNLLGEDYR